MQRGEIGRDTIAAPFAQHQAGFLEQFTRRGDAQGAPAGRRRAAFQHGARDGLQFADGGLAMVVRIDAAAREHHHIGHEAMLRVALAHQHFRA